MEREEGREERAENTGLAYVARSLGGAKVWKSELQKLQNEVLRRGLRVLLRRFGDAPWALSGFPWELLGPFCVRFWVLWVSLGMLFGCLSGFWGRATAKTPETFQLMTFSHDLLLFKGAKVK